MDKPKWFNDNNVNTGGNTYNYKDAKPTLKKGLLDFEVRGILNDSFFNNVFETLNFTFRKDKKAKVTPTLYEFATYILKELPSFEVAKAKYSIRNLIDSRLPVIKQDVLNDRGQVDYKKLTKEECASFIASYDMAIDCKTKAGLDMIIPLNKTDVALKMLFGFYFYKFNAVSWAIKTKAEKPDTQKKCYHYGITQNSKALASLHSHLNSIIKNKAITNQITIDAVFGYWIKKFQNPRIYDVIESVNVQNQKNPSAPQRTASDYDINLYSKKDVYGPGKDRLDFLLSDFVTDKPLTNTYSATFNKAAQDLLVKMAVPHDPDNPDPTKISINEFSVLRFPTLETQRTLGRDPQRQAYLNNQNFNQPVQVQPQYQPQTQQTTQIQQPQVQQQQQTIPQPQAAPVQQPQAPIQQAPVQGQFNQPVQNQNTNVFQSIPQTVNPQAPIQQAPVQGQNTQPVAPNQSQFNVQKQPTQQEQENNNKTTPTPPNFTK